MTRNLAWMDHAACRGADIELFFNPSDLTLREKALAYCRACPVQAECADYAGELEQGANKERRAGIWGGLTVRDRIRADRRTGHSGLIAARRDRIARLHRAGLDDRAIAEQVGCHERTVHRVTAALEEQRKEAAA